MNAMRHLTFFTGSITIPSAPTNASEQLDLDVLEQMISRRMLDHLSSKSAREKIFREHTKRK
jgi:hypothetical protein